MNGKTAEPNIGEPTWPRILAKPDVVAHDGLSDASREVLAGPFYRPRLSRPIQGRRRRDFAIRDR